MLPNNSKSPSWNLAHQLPSYHIIIWENLNIASAKSVPSAVLNILNENFRTYSLNLSLTAIFDS